MSPPFDMNVTDHEVPPPKLLLPRDTRVVPTFSIDWIADNLYITDMDKGRIYVSKLDGTYLSIIYEAATSKPEYIAVNSEIGYMYWTEAVTANGNGTV